MQVYILYVRYGTVYNFPHWSPTLSGLMLVLSVPVLTRSPSRLQFLLAIATRLPFWPGPEDLKRRETLFGLERPLQIPLKFSKCTQTKWCGMSAFVNTQVNTHRHSRRRPHNEGHVHLQTRFYFQQISAGQRCLLGITSDVIFVGGVDFFYSSVAEGQLSHPIHASPHTCGQT